jgi:hypothetical protein
MASQVEKAVFKQARALALGIQEEDVPGAKIKLSAAEG